MNPRDEILRAMSYSPFSMLGVTEIASRAVLSRSTVYRHLPALHAEGLVRETAYAGQWCLTPEGESRAHRT